MNVVPSFQAPGLATSSSLIVVMLPSLSRKPIEARMLAGAPATWAVTWSPWPRRWFCPGLGAEIVTVAAAAAAPEKPFFRNSSQPPRAKGIDA